MLTFATPETSRVPVAAVNWAVNGVPIVVAERPSCDPSSSPERTRAHELIIPDCEKMVALLKRSRNEDEELRLNWRTPLTRTPN